MNDLDKSFAIGCISAAAVVICIVSAIYYGMSNNNRQYHAAMQQCIEARGTWVPTQSSGACIMGNR